VAIPLTILDTDLIGKGTTVVVVASEFGDAKWEAGTYIVAYLL